MGNTALMAYQLYHPQGLYLVNEVAISEGTRNALRLPTEWKDVTRHVDQPTMWQDRFGLTHKLSIIAGPEKMANAIYEVRINCPHPTNLGDMSAVAQDFSMLSDTHLLVTKHYPSSLHDLECVRFCIQTGFDTAIHTLPNNLVPPPITLYTSEHVWKRELRVDATGSGKSWYKKGVKAVSEWKDVGKKLHDWSPVGAKPHEVPVSLSKANSYEWVLDKEHSKPSSVGWLIELVFLDEEHQANGFCSQPGNSLEYLSTDLSWYSQGAHRQPQGYMGYTNAPYKTNFRQ